MTNPQRPTPQELGDSILRGVKDFVGRAVEPLQAKLKALGERVDAMPNATMDAIKTECDVMRSEVAALSKLLEERPLPEKGEPGEKGADGSDCDMSVVETRVDAVIETKMAAAVAALPAPINGKDGENGKDGANGADCDMDAVNALVERLVSERLAEAVEKAVAAAVASIPPAKDGEAGAKGEDGLSAFHIAKQAGFDGSIADWLISLRGMNGLDGRDAEPGEPGRDGISCDEIVQFEDERSFGLRFMKGTTVLSEQVWTKPTLADLDEGTWKAGGHKRGAHVTWGGSTWFAKCDTTEEPGRGEDWRLMAKKGRDGRDRTDRHAKGDSDVYRLQPK